MIGKNLGDLLDLPTQDAMVATEYSQVGDSRNPSKNAIRHPGGDDW